MNIMSTEILNANNTLKGRNGANEIFVNPNYNFNYTDGVRDFTIENEMFWLLDLISFFQKEVSWTKEKGFYIKTVLNKDFQVWKLERQLKINKKGNVISRKNSFVLTCTDGNENILKSHMIPFSDFKFDIYTVWLQNKTLLLPEEY